MPYEVALEAVEEIRRFVSEDTTMAMFALRWIMMNEDVSVVIPGAKNREQTEANARASNVDALSADTMTTLKQIYQEKIAPHMHQRG